MRTQGLAEGPIFAVFESGRNMLLPPNFDGTQVRLALSNCQTHVSVACGDIGDLVQHVISVGTSFSHHAYIIQFLAESATGI